MRKGIWTGLALLAGTGFGGEAFDSSKEKSLVRGNTDFALDLYARLREVPGNVFFSPYSISTALAMTYAGARGQTAAEMAEVLHFGLPQEALHPAFSRLRAQVEGDAGKERRELSVANRLWGQEGHPFLAPFLAVTRDCYRAPLAQVDFIEQAEAARQAINRWIEENTRNRIKDLIEPGLLGPDTRLVLTNAIYFKGDWAKPFKRQATHPGPFFTGCGREVKTPLMNQTGNFRYLKEEGFAALELPYKGDDLSMILFLPDRKEGLPAFERTFTASAALQATEKLRRQFSREIWITLPRFEMAYQCQLSEALIAMGMPRAFDPDRADLSGMTEAADLFVDAVIHKAFVKVDEEGSEAAAATAAALGTLSGDSPPTFRADHPFLFLIRDERTGSILFMGRVVDPSGQTLR